MQKVIQYERRYLNRLKIVEPLVIFAVWTAVFEARFFLFPGEDGLRGLFWTAGLLLVTIFMYHLSRSGLYLSNRTLATGQLLMTLIRTHLLSLMTFVFLVYFLVERKLSRPVILGFFLIFLLVHISLRLMVLVRLRSLWRQGLDPYPIFFVGNSASLAKEYVHWQQYKNLGVHISHWFGTHADQSLPTEVVQARMSDFVELKQKVKPKLIVVGFENADKEQEVKFLREHFNDVVPIQVLAPLPYSVLGFKLESRVDQPLLTLNPTQFSGVDLLLKRIIDIVGSLAGILVLSPLLLLLAILVKMSSKGPIFFGQERVGQDGRVFKMWKFRSMRSDAEQVSTWTVPNDPRVTAIGALMRKTSLDELPQLWNILVGEMSVVGPRPEQPRYVEKFRSEIPAYMLRHKMKAGLTGWAQVNGWRGDTDLHKRIECDLFYIRNWSLWFDIKIIFLTVIKGIVNRNAY